MTSEQINKVRLLSGCVLRPSGFDRRFVADLAGWVAGGDGGRGLDLTPRQAWALDKLTWRYRRQLPAGVARDVGAWAGAPAPAVPRHR